VNEGATRSAIQNAIETHLKRRAGKNDNGAAFHRIAWRDVSGREQEQGLHRAYDSDPRDLAISGIRWRHPPAVRKASSQRGSAAALSTCATPAESDRLCPRPTLTTDWERSLSPEDMQM